MKSRRPRKKGATKKAKEKSVHKTNTNEEEDETESDDDIHNRELEKPNAIVHPKHTKIADIILAQNKNSEQVLFKFGKHTLSRGLLYASFKKSGEINQKVCVTSFHLIRRVWNPKFSFLNLNNRSIHL